MHNEIRKKPKSVIAAVTIAAFLLETTAISMTSSENAFAGKYENNQATSTSNSCLNPLFEPSTFDIANNIGNCGNTISQQAEGGEASSPITVQTASPTIEVQASQSPPSPPEPQTCEECFTAFLTAEQIAAFEEALSNFFGEITTIEEACAILEVTTPEELEDALSTIELLLEAAGIGQPTIVEIIDCLERVFGL